MTNRIVDFPDSYTTGTTPTITDPNLTAHLNDTTDAHDASAISNVPSGNLAATDVQAALNELQGDIDSLSGNAVEVAQDALAASFAAGTQDGVSVTYNDGLNNFDIANTDKGSTAVSSHESDVTAHPASSIVNTPSGNLAATEVQAALNELQSDIDTRATSSALTTHTSASAGVHGVTGSVVGTSDAQVLTNKDIDGGTASNTRRITIPKDTYANLLALTRKEGTIVYATDTDKVYYDDGSTLRPVGSGSGGGINFLPLSATWSPDNTDNVDAEISVGQWVAFADAASATPADLTGGSPNITIARTTTAGKVLNGNASFEITKTAANRQGEGVSCLFNVPPAYQGKLCQIKIPYKVTGTIATGDVTVWIYDVTNSLLITPLANNINQASGTLNAFFTTSPSAGTPANQQYRVGIYFGSTSAVAQTIVFDDVQVSPVDSVTVSPLSDSISYYGSNSAILDFAGEVRFNTASLVVSSQNCIQVVDDSANSRTKFVATRDCNVFVSFQGLCTGIGQTCYVYKNGSVYSAGNAASNSLNYEIDVSGNVPLKQGDFVSVGSTGTLSAAGNYSLTLIAIGSSSSTTIINPNIGPWQTYTPTFTGFGTVSTQSSRWRQVGQSIEVESRWVCGVTTATEGRLSLPNNYLSSSDYATIESCGFGASTETTNNINVLIEPSSSYVTFGTTTAARAGLTKQNGSGIISSSGTMSVKFIVRVDGLSAAGVINNPRSEIVLDTGNGSGSTNTGVRRFTNTRKSTGSAITYADSATNGASFTINEDGLYTVNYWDNNTVSDILIGITVNSSNLTGAVNTITYAQGRRSFDYVTGGEITHTTFSGELKRGDVVRAQHQSANNTSDAVVFTITKVSN